jgi:hypothetical protein
MLYSQARRGSESLSGRSVTIVGWAESKLSNAATVEPVLRPLRRWRKRCPHSLEMQFEASLRQGSCNRSLMALLMAGGLDENL